MTWKQYRKKPIIINALLIEKDSPDLIKLANETSVIKLCTDDETNDEKLIIKIKTLEGTVNGYEGGYLIRGTAGEYYTCDPIIFKQIYEKI